MERPTSTLKATSPDDLFTIVPYLLGFHPRESVVAVQVDGKRVGAVARCDIGDDPQLVAHALGPLFDRFASSDFILIAFSSDQRRGHAVLDATEVRLGKHRVIDSLLTDGVRGWSRFCDDEEGWVLPPPDELLCAEAVFSGLAPLGDRLAVVRLCAGPAADALPAVRAMFDLAAEELSSADESCGERLDRLLDAGLRDADALTGPECAHLAILAARIEWRDRAWSRMSRRDAHAHKDLWLRVVQVTPDEWAVPVLCLLGIASWLDGGGALVVSCADRARQLNPAYTMLHILEGINDHAIPPSLWDAMNAGPGKIAKPRRSKGVTPIAERARRRRIT